MNVQRKLPRFAAAAAKLQVKAAGRVSRFNSSSSAHPIAIWDKHKKQLETQNNNQPLLQLPPTSSTAATTVATHHPHRHETNKAILVPDKSRENQPSAATDAPRSLVPPFNSPFASEAEEKLVISILHKINLYDAEVRPSVKVKHLQQLSKTSFKIHEFKFDRRFLKLLKAVHNDIVPIAGAKQLQIIGCSYARLNVKTLKLWQALLRRTTKAAQKNLLTRVQYRHLGVTGPNICLILSKVAEIGVRPYEILIKLFNHLGKLSTELSVIDIERAFSAMRVLHLTPVNPNDINQRQRMDTLRALCQRVKFRIKSANPVLLVRILRHLSAVNYIPVGFLPLAEKRLIDNLKQLPPKCLASIALSYYKMKLWQPAMLDGIARAVKAKLLRIEPDTLSITFSALTQQGVRKKTFLSPICEYIATWDENIQNLSNKSIGFISASLGESGCRVQPAWKSLSSIIQSRLDKLSPHQLSQFLHGIAVVGLRDRQAIQVLLPHILKLVDTMDATSVAATLDSLALLGYYDQDLISCLLARYCRLDSATNISQQMKMRRAMVALLLEAPAIVETLPRSSQICVERFQQPFQVQPKRAFSVQLAECLKQLNLEFQLHSTLGPISFDALIIRRETDSMGASIQHRIGLNLLGPQHFCPISSERLGHARLKSRLSQRLEIDMVAINRRDWAKLPTEEERVERLRCVLLPDKEPQQLEPDKEAKRLQPAMMIM